jgi:hypothetical protein
VSQVSTRPGLPRGLPARAHCDPTGPARERVRTGRRGEGGSPSRAGEAEAVVADRDGATKKSRSVGLRNLRRYRAKVLISGQTSRLTSG